jgi:hypothetical protein
MKSKITNFKLFSLILFGFFYNSIVFSQKLENIASIAGFGNLKNNTGVATFDFDGDGDLDVFVVAEGQDDPSKEYTSSKLYRNNNDGSFTDVTATSGLTNLFPLDLSIKHDGGLAGYKKGVFFGDYDNDGFPDVLFTHLTKVQLFHNNGDGTFTDVTVAAGLNPNNGRSNTGAIWFDYNNDSFLDLYIAAWRWPRDVFDETGIEEDVLYINNTDGTFQHSILKPNIKNDSILPGFSPFPFDINNDGWMDLYITNDFDFANTLNINQSGAGFIESASSFGLDHRMDNMGMSIGDFNLDGSFDFFITGIKEYALLQNEGTNNFTETSVANNLPGFGWAWGTTFADFDLDGDEDLIVVNGYRDNELNRYYKNFAIEGMVGFEDISDQSDLNFGDESISVSVLDFDYDNDGDLDIFITNANSEPLLYENKTLNFDDVSTLQHWCKINLQGTISNRDAIGTTITLTTPTRTYKRYYTGAGFLSQSQKPVHFGLGSETQITNLEVKWPSGLIESFPNLNADETFKIIEGSGITTLPTTPSIKIKGCTDPLSCNYNPNATTNDNSCTYLPSSTISGPTSSGFFKTETYTYPFNPGTTLTWSVEEGEILDGQGTGSITVKWGLNRVNKISMRVSDVNCSSKLIELNVNLHINNLPENISIARIWNEALLEAIRNDLARPTVHARNLYHSSAVMYDVWAVYDDIARTYFLGDTLNGFSVELKDFTPSESIEESRKKAISYAMFRLLSYRFKDSPGQNKSQSIFSLIMSQLGYNTNVTNTDYETGDAAALGNYIAQKMIEYGNQDGSRELDGFKNSYYLPVNDPLVPQFPTNELLNDPNRWQALELGRYIDQSGNFIPGRVIPFLSAEWGNVYPFAMDDNDKTTYSRDGNNYHVYQDPGTPPLLNLTTEDASSTAYKDGFSMVSIWQSHLDPTDGVMWDISPGAIGNTDISTFPTSYADYPSFYNYTEGGDIGTGHTLNPVTGMPYTPQIVPRGDYARVLAEFWADGPHSETPPGHWFTILNYVGDHPLFEKKFEGEGELLDPLEWDVKCYFILGGAMHDAAIAAWSVKGWYDYTRPISAIRNMALLGQSSDPLLTNYHVAGIPLRPGYVEVVNVGDPLAGSSNENVGKIKLYTWRGHDFISDTETDFAGVGWVLAENWWTYQRPTFVTPPFAGFVSGHSTYSRAASEVLTLITGNPFFPGGLGEFKANKNEFLVFEEGPSVDVVLQWATYRDASDQTSLSRIWGGIHPPQDDIPGRLIGDKVGKEAYAFAVPYFSGKPLSLKSEFTNEFIIYPNPTVNKELYISNTLETDQFGLYDLVGRKIEISSIEHNKYSNTTHLKFPNDMSSGTYIVKINTVSKLIFIKN